MPRAKHPVPIAENAGKIGWSATGGNWRFGSEAGVSHPKLRSSEGWLAVP